jgi:pimeloyl-ACP methyl ester carboxylesterase
MHRTLRLHASPWPALSFLALLIAVASTHAADFGPGFKTQSVAVDGGTVSVTVGGSGPPVLLLHGYAETSRMWKPLANRLAPRFTVIAPDLPGIGDSSIRRRLDMKTSAEAYAAVNSLGYKKVRVVGHDIGLMVAYAYAALYPQGRRRSWMRSCGRQRLGGGVQQSRHLALPFYGATPEALVKGRERLFEHFWNDSRPTRPADLATGAHANVCASGRMAAGFAYFASFPKTAVDFAELAKTRLAFPVLSIGGAKANGVALGAQARLIASDVTVVVLDDTGHWILEERPEETIKALSGFL